MADEVSTKESTISLQVRTIFDVWKSANVTKSGFNERMVYAEDAPLTAVLKTVIPSKTKELVVGMDLGNGDIIFAKQVKSRKRLPTFESLDGYLVFIPNSDNWEKENEDV